MVSTGSGADGTEPAPDPEAARTRPRARGAGITRAPWQRRRDRWGKLPREASCPACGRRLWVNWARHYPCLWCDEHVRKLWAWVFIVVLKRAKEVRWSN